MLTQDWSVLTQWIESAIQFEGIQVQVKLRGSDLHIMCEAFPCPPEKLTVSKLSNTLEHAPLETLLRSKTQSIDKIFLSGRGQGAKRPEWTVKMRYDASTATFSSTSGLGTASSLLELSSSNQLNAILALDSEEQEQARINGILSTAQPTSESIIGPVNSIPVIHAPASAVSPRSLPLLPSIIQQNDSTVPKVKTAENPVVSHSVHASSLIAPTNPLPQVAQLPSGSPTADSSMPDSSTPVGTSRTVPGNPTLPPQTRSASRSPSVQDSSSKATQKATSEAIAQSLSQILGSLGVTIKVGLRPLRQSRDSSTLDAPLVDIEAQPQRLWIVCESVYSPDPSLLAEPIAEHLRKLKLESLYQHPIRDALILLQVQGESKPDWMLRVDLTPPDQILQDWARWGDEQAIAHLLNQQLMVMGVSVRATLKESTLYVFSQFSPAQGRARGQQRKKRGQRVRGDAVPDQQQVRDKIAPLLEALAPQGIHAAALYGVEAIAEYTDAPGWIEWLNLPASVRSDLQPSAAFLAQQGNVEALKFILSRLINPDLTTKLATGGIRVLLLQKGKVLHVMTEAPTCPSQSKVVPRIVQAMHDQPIGSLEKIRVYGRRAGQKYPLWRYGFTLSSSLAIASGQVELTLPIPEVEDGAPSADEFMLHSEVRPEILEDEVSFQGHSVEPLWQRSIEQLSNRWQQGLIASRLFISQDRLVPVGTSTPSRYQKTGLALVWGALGCLLALQADLILGQLLQPTQLTQISAETRPIEGTDPPATSTPKTENEVLSRFSPLQAVLPQSQPSPPERDEVFQSSEFVGMSDPSASVSGALHHLAYPTFDSEQLDEQLIRYQQYLATEKRPPDILILGSSRALRGIDPRVLEQALARQGHQLRVFNFGVNGATLQVVDLILSRILPPEQLPKLVIIADGVRALNGGRADRTYETIATSEGYQRLAQGQFRILLESEPEATQTQSDPSQSSKSSLGQGWLDQRLTEISMAYPQRDRLKQTLQILVRQKIFVQEQSVEAPDQLEELVKVTQEAPRLERNGFLPLEIQFDPVTYYENHSRVSGYYDSDYQSFELDGIQMDALRRLAQYTQTHDVGLVFVNMPLTHDYLDEVRVAYEDKFQQSMEQLAASTNFTFVNLAFQWMDAYTYFSDPSHLNQIGAAAVSQHLAENSTIPWPKP
ncbi:MAG: hypothetical protein ACRC8A_10905 [Microcoleaceae cyanobacterium]